MAASVGTGEDDGVVSAEPHVRRGRAREHTFQRNLTDPAEIRGEVDRLARELAADIPSGRAVVRATVKVRFAPFFTSTHAAKLPEPTTDADAIVAGAFRALERFELDRPVRLVGVRVEFTDPPPED